MIQRTRPITTGAHCAGRGEEKLERGVEWDLVRSHWVRYSSLPDGSGLPSTTKVAGESGIRTSGHFDDTFDSLFFIFLLYLLVKKTMYIFQEGSRDQQRAAK